MKKRNGIIFLVILGILLVLQVVAHPGGTDSRGGHHDRQNGGYHYHHGYEAHDHYDIDGDGKTDCPIIFERNQKAKLNENKSAWERVGDVVTKGFIWFWVMCSVSLFMWALVKIFKVNLDGDGDIGCGCFVFLIIMKFIDEMVDSYSYTALYVVLGIGLLSLLFLLLHRKD